VNTINDIVHGGRHVGSHAVRAFIEKYQPLACITGHIHEGIGIDKIGRTQIINPGPFRNGYYFTFSLHDEVRDIELKQIQPGI
jgi:Icc-related predicted phosphoesterase